MGSPLNFSERDESAVDFDVAYMCLSVLLRIFRSVLDNLFNNNAFDINSVFL